MLAQKRRSPHEDSYSHLVWIGTILAPDSELNRLFFFDRHLPCVRTPKFFFET